MRFLTLALPKGKLFQHARSLLEKLNLQLPSESEIDRRLIIDLPKEKMRILLVRPTDVPTYVEHGAADMGIIGSDLLLEQGRDLYEPVDLRFGGCRLILAEPEQKKEVHRKLRIATKYSHITEQYFSERAIPIEIIKLYGSVELAPLVGLADQIVDLSETGATLKANGLIEVDEIARCSARMIVNRASLKLEYPAIQKWIAAFKQGVL